MGLEAYGLVGLYAALQAWLSVLDMGLTPTLSREVARASSGDVPFGRTWNLLRSVELSLAAIVSIFVVGATLTASYITKNWLTPIQLSSSTVSWALAIMSYVAGLRLLENIYKATLIGLQQQRILNLISILSVSIRTFGAVAILTLVTQSVVVFFFWQALISGLTLLSFFAAAYATIPRENVTPKFSLDAIRSVSKYAGGVAAVTLVSLVLSQLDKFLLSGLLDLSEFGRYTLASAVAATLYVLISPITQAWFPRFCALSSGNETGKLADAFHDSAQLVSVVHGSAACFLIVFADHLILTWTGRAELAESVSPILRILAFANLIHGTMWIPYQLQLSAGWTSLALCLNLAGLAILTPAFLVLVPRYGTIAAAWLIVAVNSLYLIAGAPIMFKKLLSAEGWSWVIFDVALPLTAALTAAILVRGLLQIGTGLIAEIATLASGLIATYGATLTCSPRLIAKARVVLANTPRY